MYQIVAIRPGQHDLLVGQTSSAREALQLCHSTAAADHAEVCIVESDGSRINLDELTRRADAEIASPG